MKNLPVIVSVFAILAAASCDKVVSTPAAAPGILRLSLGAPAEAKGGPEIPDTNLFILTVTEASGKSVFSGAYSSAPKEMELPGGKYIVRAVSRGFDGPLFDAPQFGDEQEVEVRSDVVTGVHLQCTPRNAGIRLRPSRQFIAENEGGIFYVHSASGSLVFPYGEDRTGYFRPGPVWLDFAMGGTTSTLLARELFPGDMLTLRIEPGATIRQVSPVAEEYGDGITIAVDTSRNWVTETVTIGGRPDTGGESGGDAVPDGALSVGQARARAPEGLSGVWVYGYVAGGDCTAAGCSFSPPFKSATNMVIAPSTASAVRDECLAVQLKKGDLRDALNLADHPENLGRLVYLKGTLVAKYYGLPGLQDITDWRLK